MSIQLKSLDERFVKLDEAGGIESAQRAISSANGVSLHSELSRCYGALQEVICLSGPHCAKSILVFEGGVGLLAGADSLIPILTFGYSGTGSRIFSSFLSAAGFTLTDASQFQPPLIVRRDGSTMKGVTQGIEIRWEDGTTTLIPKFLGEQQTQSTGGTMNWYQAESIKKSLRQVVIEIPSGLEKESEFGMLFLAGKYLALMMNVWGAGFFRLDNAPGPYLMIRGDKVVNKLRGSPMKAAFSFYRMKAGGLVTVYLYADCPAVAQQLQYPIVLFEMAYGCDQYDTKSLVHDAISRDTLHICFAEGDGPGEMSGGIFSGSSINAQYDIVVPLPADCRAILKQELEAIFNYHSSIPSSRRDFEQSSQQMWAENPQTDNPILPRQSADSISAASSSTQSGQVVPPKKSKMGKIFGVAIVLILAAGLLPWARKEWLRHKTVTVKPAKVSIHANQPKDDHASTSAAATTKLPEKTAAQRSSEYLALNAKRKGVITTASGLQYEIIRAGAGPKPKAEDSIRALYHGTLINGSVFDSSLEQKEPATMALKEVIPGWSEGLQLMSQGAKYKFFIPAKLAYGEKGTESVGPHEALIFEVELVEIRSAVPPVVMQPGVYQGSTIGIPSFSVSLVADDQGLKASELGYEFAGFASVGHAFLKSKQPFGTFGNGTLTFQFRVLTSIQVPNLNTSGANLGSANYQAEITSEKDGVLKCELSQIAELAQAYSDFSFEEITFHFEEKNPALQKNYTLVLQSAQKGGSGPAASAPSSAVKGTAVTPPNQPAEPFVVVARDPAEEQVWEQACKERTIRAFKAYMAAYPSGLYAAEARAKQAILRLDDAPYAAALKQGTESAMKAFLNDFPGHSNEADMQRALKDLTEGRNK